jgi:hypothetical protein
MYDGRRASETNCGIGLAVLYELRYRNRKSVFEHAVQHGLERRLFNAFSPDSCAEQIFSLSLASTSCQYQTARRKKFDV